MAAWLWYAVVAAVLCGATIMAIVGILFFREPLSWQGIAGVAFAIIGLFLLRKQRFRILIRARQD
jgi:drug/metabolite transporter (DMT)-like permease